MWTLVIIWANGCETVRTYPDEESCWEMAYQVDEPGAEVLILHPDEDW